MIVKMNMLSKWLAAAGVSAVVVAGAASPSFAAMNNHHIRAHNSRAYSAHASVAMPRAHVRRWRGGGYFAHGAADDPPGSAFQTFGNDQAMGLVR